MKKLLLILLTLLLIINKLEAQVSGTLYYTLYVHDGFTPSDYNLNYITYFTNSKSLQLTLKKDSLKSEIQMIDPDHISKKIVVPSNKNSVKFVFKDYNKNLIQYTDQISNNNFFIIDTLDNFNWIILNEKSKIKEFDCTKAITNFRGRNYIAWFDDKIPLRFGPWKFGGLPGLIVKVEDDEKKYVFELSGIDLTPLKDLNFVKIPDTYKENEPISYFQFREYLNKKLDDFERQSRVVLIDGNAKIQNEIKLPPKMEKY